MSNLERSLGGNLPSSEHYLGLTNVSRSYIGKVWYRRFYRPSLPFPLVW